MNYVNYEKSIILKYHVKLVGWPDDVKFTNPASLTSVQDLRKLRQALRTQTCHWAKPPDREIKYLRESIDAREAAGESVGHKRKRRSDKGKPRKKAALNPSDEEEGDEDGEDGDGDDYETEDNDLSPGPSSSRRQTRSKAAGRRRGPASKSRKVAINEDEDDKDEDNEPSGSSAAAASSTSRRCTRSAKAGTRRKFKSKEVIRSDEDMDNEAV